MSFWNYVQTAAGMAGAFHWVALSFVLAALVLSALVPTERKRIRAAMLLFLISVAALFVAAALLYYGSDPAKSTAYRWVRWAAPRGSEARRVCSCSQLRVNR